MTATATATPYGYCPTCGAPDPLTEPPKCAVTGKTEAEALVAALEVAP